LRDPPFELAEPPITEPPIREDPEEERPGVDENLCQPPPLPDTLARAEAEPIELPDRGMEPPFALPRMPGLWLKR